MKARSLRGLKADCNAFNQRAPIGTRVLYWPGSIKRGLARESRTRSEASVLGGHTAVVWVEGYSGCIALAHVEVLS